MKLGRIAFALLFSSLPCTSSAQALLYFNSQPTDYIGEGRELTLTSAEAVFDVERNSHNGVSFDVAPVGAGPGIVWSLDLAAPGDAALMPGAYEGARQYTSQATTEPGLFFAGEGRDCTSLAGRFDVLEAVYDPGSGQVVRFAVDFEQHCEGVFPALLGWVRYNSFVPAPRVVPGTTTIRKEHFQSARDRIDVLRKARGLPPAAWTDLVIVPGVTRVLAAHTTELRTRLNEVYSASGQTLPFPSPAMLPGATIRAKDINDVLDAIGAIEGPHSLSEIGPSIVSVSGRRVLVQRRKGNGVLAAAEPYIIRGVVWSPASRDTITSPTDPQNANRRRPEFGIWYRTDVPLLRAVNVNTVRLLIDPGFDGTLGPIGIAVLDELYRNGIMVIMTVDDAINDLVRIQGAVSYYRNHPAILMWSLGSEWNINHYFRQGSWTTLFAAQRTEIAAQLVKSLDGNHPVVSSYGEIDFAGSTLAETTEYVRNIVPSVDIWSLNLYRGNSFDNAANQSVFDQWAGMTGKPMFIGEFGIDAFHGTCLTTPPSGFINEVEQVVWNVDLWNDIARNLSASDAANAALGGTVFEWNDEWWKTGSPTVQESGGWTSDGFPDWHGTEEYFGLLDIDRGPRQVYYALANAFASSYVPGPHTITFRAISRGANICGAQADFRRDGHTFYQRFGFGSGGRGFNVAVVDPADGEIVDSGRNFDTWGGGDPAKQALIDYLNAVPNGQLIMLAVADEAGITLSGGQECTPRTDATTVALVQFLQALGSTRIDEYCFRGSWAMVAVKGAGVALAEGYQRFDEARAEPAIVVAD